MEKRPGIYKILNIFNGKAYIGSSSNAPKRLNAHAYLLRHGKHHSPQLQRSWDRDGPGAFLFSIIERCDKSDLLKREQLWMNHLQTYDDRFGYNVGAVAGTREGVPQPLSHSERMRQMHIGKPKTAEHKARIGAGNRGKMRSDETKQALREKAARQYENPEARRRSAAAAKLRNLTGGNPFKGRTHTAASRATMSEKAQARWKDFPRKPRSKRVYVPTPPELRKKTGPKPGAKRLDRRTIPRERILEIRAAAAHGASYTAMEKMFGMNAGSLYRIVHRKTYADIE